MKTEFEYLILEKIGDTGKTTIWDCSNKHHGYHLGTIKWWSTWRQYCFIPENDTVFSAGCMKDIQTFIEELMKERKNEKH